MSQYLMEYCQHYWTAVVFYLTEPARQSDLQGPATAGRFLSLLSLELLSRIGSSYDSVVTITIYRASMVAVRTMLISACATAHIPCSVTGLQNFSESCAYAVLMRFPIKATFMECSRKRSQT